jgi:hypothetical protein
VHASVKQPGQGEPHCGGGVISGLHTQPFAQSSLRWQVSDIAGNIAGAQAAPMAFVPVAFIPFVPPSSFASCSAPLPAEVPVPLP